MRAAVRESELVVIHKSDLFKCFASFEIDRFRSQHFITFPTEADVKKQISVIEK